MDARWTVRPGRGALVLLAAGMLALACTACGGSPSPSAAATAGTAASGGSVAVFVHVREVQPQVSSPDVAAAGWPFPGDPATFGQPFTSTLDAWPVSRCAVLDTATAEAGLAALPAGVLLLDAGAAGWRIGTLGWAARGMDVLLMVEDVTLADAGRTCEQLWMARFDPAGA